MIHHRQGKRTYENLCDCALGGYGDNYGSVPAAGRVVMAQTSQEAPRRFHALGGFFGGALTVSRSRKPARDSGADRRTPNPSALNKAALNAATSIAQQTNRPRRSIYRVTPNLPVALVTGHAQPSK